MNKSILLLLIGSFSLLLFSQNETPEKREMGHYNNSMFKELESELPTPNVYRTASGAPGHEYYQQQADYDMQITLDDETQMLYGEETITYTNNSPDNLEYLWVQLDQNVRDPESDMSLVKTPAKARDLDAESFTKQQLGLPFQGGFKIEHVQNANGKKLSHSINNTMMRINLTEPLPSGSKFVFSIKWNYLINNYLKDGGRSGYEHFKENNNNLYVIAQFFPRMAVYNDVYGWQNSQFWGRSEFALPFGDYNVNITVPTDHVINGTGKITNLKEVLSKTEYKRWEKAQKSFDKPVMIVTEEEARQKEKNKVKKTQTWNFKAENVRDFGFSTSRKFIWDAMAVNINNKTVMAVSLYPKEGNPLWEDYSTRAVAHTLKEYSKMTFDYPYHKAISVHANYQGMEYPMICWNYGRPNPDGTYTESTKHGMISVIIHEIGHNFFPMIVNSDERQWTWMDEGLNTFLQFVAEQNMPLAFDEYTWENNYPSRRGFAKDIVDYMSLEQRNLMPIMTKGDHVFNFGANAYGKPATGLAILRESIMGEELFDYAFRTYAQRWKFKHPTPADFFRTMEDASAMDLDWFWRGWFYTTEYTDLEIQNVKQFYINEKAEGKIGFTETPSGEISGKIYEQFSSLKKHIATLPKKEVVKLKNPKYFYEVTYNKPGGLIMPLLVTFEFTDGTEQEIRYPYYLWARKEHRALSKFYGFEKEVKKITLDKKLETADIDVTNNVWQKK